MDKLDLLPGTLDLLVLQTLAAQGRMHGYGIGKLLEEMSSHQLSLNPGTVYASLVRLQQNGWIRSEWGLSDNNRRAKFYLITGPGSRQLARETDAWQRLAAIMQTALVPAGSQ